MTIPEFLLPFGPLHIVFLHLPIGGLIALCFVLFVLPNDGYKHRNSVVGLLHLFLLCSTAITIVLGLAYEVYGQYEEELDLHVLWGYIFGGAVLVNYVLYWFHRVIDASVTRWLYLLTLAFAAISMTITGHQGGDLVHGKGFLTKPFRTKQTVSSKRPEPVQTPTELPQRAPAVAVSAEEETVAIESDTMMGASNEMDAMAPSMDAMTPSMDTMAPSMDAVPLPAEPPTNTVSDEDVALYEAAQLVFKNHCYNCHGATKQKGDLRLDLEVDAFAGGDSGPISIVPHDAEGSLIIERMRLPRHDDDAMPPEKKPAASIEEIEAVAAWIQSGAVWPDMRARAQRDKTLFVEIDDEVTGALMDRINATGAKAEYNSWNDARVRVDLSFTDADKLDDAFAQLNAFGDKLIWLDLTSLDLPASLWKQLASFSNLERLHLDGTNVNDSNLQALTALPKLSYLNLFDTAVSDSGLDSLKSIPSLEKVYLGQTKVTKGGVSDLSKSKPKLQVIHR